MRTFSDQDFRAPAEKSSPFDPDLPTSKLSVLSLVFGILGMTGLPVLGSIVAIATGKAAQDQIRDSGGRLEGRAMARVGVTLGTISLAFAISALMMMLLYVSRRGQEEMIPSDTVRVTTPTEDRTESGVKMVNQMGREDFQTIEAAGLKVPEGEIIGCYNEGGTRSNPEFALITTKRLIYLKDGRTTEFDLNHVAHIKNDEAFERAYNPLPNNGYQPDQDIYHIEVISTQGPRMHIAIRPEKGGALFQDALIRAIQGTGVALTPG